MTNLFLLQVLNYEEQVFNRFINNRTKLINLLKTIKVEDFDRQQLLNFVKSIKNITQTVKCADEFVNEFFSRDFLDNFEKENTENEFIQFYLLFKDIFFTTNSDSDSDPELSSVSSISSESESESSSDVSSE